MIKKQQLLEAIGFKFNGDGFECVGCPKALKFTMKELDAMSDKMFTETMRQHEKSHPIKFEDSLFEYSGDVAGTAKKPTNSTGKIKTTSKATKTEEKNEKTETKPAIKVAPALPPKLIQAGLQTVLLQPKQAFIKAGGTEQEFAKEINFAAQHLMKNDYIISCAKNNPEYLVEAVKTIALTGLTLNPELKLGYLVPRKGKIYFSSSYMGKREIVNRTGHVKDSYAALVHEKDKFEVHKGTDPHIKHIPHPWGDRGPLMGGYWVCMLSNGSVSFDTMTKERIEEIRKRSEAVKAGKGSPWDTDYEEMALKTIYNWGFKFMPKTGLSDNQIKALEVEAKYDNEVFEDWVKNQDKKAEMFDDDGPADDYQDAKVIE
jgi:recombination protein RecT